MSARDWCTLVGFRIVGENVHRDKNHLGIHFDVAFGANGVHPADDGSVCFGLGNEIPSGALDCDNGFEFLGAHARDNGDEMDYALDVGADIPTHTFSSIHGLPLSPKRYYEGMFLLYSVGFVLYKSPRGHETVLNQFLLCGNLPWVVHLGDAMGIRILGPGRARNVGSRRAEVTPGWDLAPQPIG